jgi:hypothetical protein
MIDLSQNGLATLKRHKMNPPLRRAMAKDCGFAAKR